MPCAPSCRRSRPVASARPPASGPDLRALLDGSANVALRFGMPRRARDVRPAPAAGRRSPGARPRVHAGHPPRAQPAAHPLVARQPRLRLPRDVAGHRPGGLPRRCRWQASSGPPHARSGAATPPPCSVRWRPSQPCCCPTPRPCILLESQPGGPRGDRHRRRRRRAALRRCRPRRDRERPRRAASSSRRPLEPPTEPRGGHPVGVRPGAPFQISAVEAAIADIAVAVIQLRGEPTRFERILGEVLLGLDHLGPPAPAGGHAARVRARRTMSQPTPRRPGFVGRRQRPAVWRPAAATRLGERGRWRRQARCTTGGARRARATRSRRPRTSRSLTAGHAARGPGRMPASRDVARRCAGLRPGAPHARPHPPGAAPARSPAPRRDRGGPLVAARPTRPRGRQGAALRAPRMGHLQPADRRAAASARPPSTSASAGSSADPRRPTSSSCEPAWRAIAAPSHRPTASSAPTSRCRAAMPSTARWWACSRTFAHRLGMRVWIDARASSAARTRASPWPTCSATPSSASTCRSWHPGRRRCSRRSTASGTCGARRLPLRGRVDGRLRRARPAARPAHRDDVMPSCASSWSPTSACPGCASTGALAAAAATPGGGQLAYPRWSNVRRLHASKRASLADLAPLLGLDPQVERGEDQLALFGW